MAITTRESKGSVLTHAEMDTNLLELNKRLGVDQTWQDVTSNRVSGTTYTNTTGKPIQIIIRTNYDTGNNLFLYINGICIDIVSSDNSIINRMSTTAIVPNGATYKVDVGTYTLEKWYELR